MTEPHIRPATPADAVAIAAIYAHAVTSGTASFELEPPDAAEIGRRMAAVLDGGHPWLVAETAADGIAGYAYAGPYRPRPAYRSTVEDAIYIRPDRHRSGLGRRLLAALIIEATARGFHQMVAVVGDSASAGSIGLHRALGFREVGVLRAVGFKHGRWLDTVILQRELAPMGGAGAPPPAL
ncbi:GNAT family N-acetyltransferase [Methylobrevis albus]|uniref:N-acetyltransferase n=1 Tax=Methylobrevis albus TaxID=2793297 RepID=A0A931MYE8_9HYPH|nr:GNAT family N-acetyltransferase [Methylobrevis albus]MBH0237925.1 N-acetyltransferase [Methylobrevis albus]